MNFIRSKRGMAVLVLVLLVLFLFRPGVYGLRHRIAGSIGSALGRRVELDNVRVHVLPQPGFDLEGLVIYDDPTFSPEPMVRAQDVSANIRLRSLLRGRLEIARLSATEPSINLVRNHEGRWNLANLLERNSRIPVAPTGKAPSERRPAFPYLEATHARINFKIEQEKKPYALTDADVALWQESENSWGARMKAEPVRTDFNLTDTGLVELNATWQRAADLRATPVQVTVQWEKGQLGQITKLLSGKDRGWRGGVNLSANFSGTPEALQVRSQIGIADFHRYDIVESESVRLSANCGGRYSVTNGTLTDVLCESPVTGGALKIMGSLGPVIPSLRYDLSLAADKIPAMSLLRVLRQAKKQLPADLTATGLVKIDIHAERNGPGPANIVGDGVATNVRLFKNGGQDEVVFGNIPLTFVTAAVAMPGKALNTNLKTDQQLKPQLKVGNVSLSLGGTSPAIASGWITSSSYSFMLTGETSFKNLFRLADTIGIGGARPAAEGLAKVALNISGAWQGFSAPTISGTAQLRNVRAELRGINTPIEIGTASLALTPEMVSLEKIAGQTGTTHWTGKVNAPRHCAPAECIFQFDLTADRLSSEDLHDWFVARSAKRAWYRVLNLSEQAGPSPLLGAKASGTLRIAKFDLKKVLVSQISTQFDLDRGKITLSNLRGQFLQGTHQGNWTIDASVQPVKYQARGTLQNISLTQVSALTNDAWITGTGDAKFEGTTSGLTWPDVVSNTNATFHFTMRDGNLPHLAATAGAVSVHKLAGDLQLDKGTWELSGARLESRDGIYQVSGRASANSGLNFTLLRNDDRSWTLFGTLAKPRLELTSRTQAQATVSTKP